LEIQRSTGAKESIFLEQQGRAINAFAVESWFVAHPCVGGGDTAYFFYVMNFTEFDSPDHSQEHWYNVTETDLEASNRRDYWRLQWDNALNPNVKFPYAAFTSQSRVLFIDASAFQWYLTWARIWWGLTVGGPKYDYYYEDLDQFLATHDVKTPLGKTALGYYLAGWIDDPLQNLLAPYIWDDVGIFTTKSMSVQTLVLNNASEAGYSNEAMRWIINKTLVKESLMDLAPYVDVDVTAEFVYLSSYPELEAIFDGAVLAKQNGWTYYDGGLIWDGLYSVREAFFNLTAADIVINSYVFLETNMSMIIYGEEYTGLGGGGQILVMKAVERYFKPDGVTPRSGLGATLIHEAGHNLGFDHTFTHGVAYAGDFAFDAMGYYPLSYSFTQMRKDCWRRLIDDHKILRLQDTLEEDQTLYNRKPPVPAIDPKFNDVQAKINEARQLCDGMHYLEAYDKMAEAEASERGLNELIWRYICDINNDGEVNIYDVVRICAAYGTRPGHVKWDPDADLVKDYVINIYDIVAATSRYAKKWQPS
jgi:hypothetical protein